MDASCASHGETSLLYLFSGCSALTTINGLENLKTSGVTNMASMFEGCTNLANIYIGDD